MVFIYLEKAYDRVPREVTLWALGKKGVPLKYIKLIKNIYDGVVTSVRTSVGIRSEFPVTTNFHKDQESALSPYLFALVMDELIKLIQEEVPRCIPFADDKVLNC